jgi:hypothetical protein
MIDCCKRNIDAYTELINADTSQESTVSFFCHIT